jgi:hypothetical protein
MNPIIIGIGHYSRTGKDTFANGLIDALNDLDPGLRVGRRSFATKLKEVTSELYGWAGLRGEAYYNRPEHEHERDVVLPALGMTPVDIWVKFGTPAVREQVYDLTWVDYLLKTDHGLDVIVIPDVRFPNEVRAIQETGGHLIKIVRDGYGPKMTVADLALIYFEGWDNVFGDQPIDSDYTGIENLQNWGLLYGEQILQGKPLSGLRRSDQAIREALAVQRMPSKADVLAVYEAAGLKFEEYGV